MVRRAAAIHFIAGNGGSSTGPEKLQVNCMNRCFDTPKDPQTPLPEFWPHGSGDADLYKQLKKKKDRLRLTGELHDIAMHYCRTTAVLRESLKNSDEGQLPSIQTASSTLGGLICMDGDGA